MTEEKMNAIAFGLGPIGIKILQNCMKSESIRLIGAVDIDPDKIGKDAGELAGGEAVGIKISASVAEIEASVSEGRKFALHATGSNLRQVWPQFKELLDHGYSIVSTCEELSYPWSRYPELSREIDTYARVKRQVVIGTGINPGFVMDALAVFMTSVTETIKGIQVYRSVDVSRRRIPLQKKVGIGMTPEDFLRLAAEDRIGHVGLEESLRLIGAALNLTFHDVQNSIEPAIATEDTELTSGPLKANDVCGLHQISQGMSEEGIPVVLDLVMSAHVPQEDRIVIDTDDLGKVETVIPGGIFGDTATVNVVVNTAKTLCDLDACGLLTMADIRLTRNIHR
ncbi:hypothetical protein AB6A23_23190 [Paenibacillus tarimensis]